MRAHTPLRPAAARAGFTLIELMVVIGLLGLIAAIAMPQLIPSIVFSDHEGASRRLAAYGRGAVSYSAFLGERITVKIDLDNQEYWAERWPNPPIDEDEEKDNTDRRPGRDRGGLFDRSAGSKRSDSDEASPLDALLAARQAENGGQSGGLDEADMEALEKESEMMRKRFDHMAKRSLMVRAEHVKHDEAGLLKDIGNFFEDDFTLDDNEAELLEPEEIYDFMLERTRFPHGVYISSVAVGEEEHTSGIVEVNVTAQGFDDWVAFFVENEDGDVYTVEWDPIVNGARFKAGREISPRNADE